MANRFTYPRETALDSNGDPLSGAKLYFYESSTTKAADTFSDEGLTVANANPVVADSAGRFGDIWLKAQDYKVVLTDSDDVTIWTADPVHGTLDVSGDDFKAGPQSPADMTVLVASGSLYDLVSKTLVSKSAQSSPLITAPSSNPRKDIVHIDRLTGVIGIDTGTEAASPVDPTISDDKLPVARITLATTTTTIDDSLITDIRELGLLGAIGGEHIQNQQFSYATSVGGTADVVTAVFTPVLTAFTEGMRLALKVATTNTGAVTLNPDGLGAKAVKKGDGATALAAGDWTAGQIVEVEYDSVNFQMVSNVVAPPSTVLQVVQVQDGEVATGTSQIPLNDTIPQNTEGTEFMTLAITPKNAASRLLIQVQVSCKHSSGTTHHTVALFKDSVADALAAVTNGSNTGLDKLHLPLNYDEASGSTTARTYKVRMGASTAGTVTFNGQAGSRLFGGVMASSIIITEYLP